MQKILGNSQIKKRAFSLIELSVVITIAALIATAVISLNNSSAINDKNKITKDRIDKIYKAMGTYLAINARLPCPASMLLAKTNSSYGTEVTCSTVSASTGIWQNTWSNNLVYGMVPTKTLGLPSETAEDGFGNKLAYVIIKGFTNSTLFGKIDEKSNYIYDDGSSAICKRIKIHKKVDSTYSELTTPGTGYSGGATTTCDTTYPNNQEAIFVIISNGANKLGGFPATGTSQDISSFSGSGFPAGFSDEGFNMFRIDGMGNDYTGPRGYFYNYGTVGSDFWTPFVKSSNNSSFDDIVFYKTRNAMVADFKLYNLIPCAAQTISSYGYPQSYYGEIAQATSGTQCANWPTTGVKYPTRRCGMFGTWESNVITNCS